jgi:hypothetical protein
MANKTGRDGFSRVKSLLASRAATHRAVGKGLPRNCLRDQAPQEIVIVVGSLVEETPSASPRRYEWRAGVVCEMLREAQRCRWAATAFAGVR